MTRSVLGFRLSTSHPAPVLRAKRKIEKPRSRAAKKSVTCRKWPFAAMEIGESFFVSDRIRSQITAAASSHRDRSFATRPAKSGGKEGFRVWRVQ